MVLTQGVVLPRREHFAVFGDIFDCHIWGRRLLPASRRLRTGMLLNILECKVQFPPAKNYSIQSIGSATVDKPYWREIFSYSVCRPLALPRWPSAKEPTARARRKRQEFDPGPERSPGGGRSSPLQCSCLESPWVGEPGGLPSRAHRELDETEWLSAQECVRVCTTGSLRHTPEASTMLWTNVTPIKEIFKQIKIKYWRRFLRIYGTLF